MRRLKRIRKKTIILLGVGLGVLLTIFALIFFKSITAPLSSSDSRVEFIVEKGSSAKRVGIKLFEAGLIRSPLGFRLAVKRAGLESGIQAGTYYLSPDMSASAIALSLTRGISDIKFTIPEGFRLEQIASVVEAKLGIPATDFMQASIGLEGYLFPDTYFVPAGVNATKVVGLMHDNFIKKFGELDQETVTLASLVERETKGTEEKPIVAGILKKRLAAGWPLELDATVQYAVGDSDNWWPNTTLADRQVKSRYNTYLSLGLPPGPICAPGSASLQAVLAPKSSDYWFYLHGKDGQIHYATTNAEHTANISKYIAY